MEYPRLDDFLTQNQISLETVIHWEYYGYGFFNCRGVDQRKDLPVDVKFAGLVNKKIDGENIIYQVDGAVATIDAED